jgi:hypothetical protein
MGSSQRLVQSLLMAVLDLGERRDILNACRGALRIIPGPTSGDRVFSAHRPLSQRPQKEPCPSSNQPKRP